ncbi:MAG: NRDE family protein [Actinomycetes bacterium]
MCTIVFAWSWRPGVSLVLAANRDEGVDRPSDPPALLRQTPPLWGGRDLLAGGTWLAVDPRGRVCAVTNRHPGGRRPERDAARRSRGEVPLTVLEGGDDLSATRAIDAMRAEQYNPVNVLYLSAGTAYWGGLDDEAGVRRTSLAPGVHVLTEQDPDDPASEKAAALLGDARCVAERATDADELLLGFRSLLRSHDRRGRGPEAAACIHETLFGTVSSATVTVSPTGTRYEHAEGHPCVTEYQSVLPA